MANQSQTQAVDRQFLITITPEYEPEDGDQFDALMSALEHFEIAASVVEVSKDEHRKLVETAPLANNQYLHESIRRLQKGLDCYTEEAPEYAEISAALSALQSLISPVTPRIVIGLEGGIIQGATANVPIEYLVYDYDIEGADDDEIAVRPALAGGEVEVFDSGVRIPEINAAIVDKVFAAAKCQ